MRFTILLMLCAFAAAGADEDVSGPLRYDVPAPSLGGGTRDVQVWVPPGYAAKAARFPVVYLLHGFPGTAGNWFGRGRAAQTAQAMIRAGEIPPVIMVCPDGNRGFLGRSLYANSADGTFRMEDFMTRDLVSWVDSTFRTRTAARDRAVIGLSDGGTAAVNLALRHRDLFGAAGAHSADFRLKRDFGMASIVGPAAGARAMLDALSPLVYLRESVSAAGVALYFDCGADDKSLADNFEMHALLDSLAVAHTFHKYPGSHTWTYWRSHLRESLAAVTAGMR